MTSNDIRKKFLDFFAARGHRVVRSSSLVPANDPTLLFTNAGMNQFKDVFLGREKSAYGGRVVSCQKCVRAGGKHNDLEQVGRTTRHHTFFEMLGNFSFGDYFKKEAIPWAWELVTKDFAIAKDKLYVTVFREDDEAEEIWARDVGVARSRIFRRDEKDNFWAMGETGPCGPCSEIHYDLGPAASDLGHKDCQFPCADDCGRYVEIWNLVFMQFNRDEQGTLSPLPRPSIDTGAGLERLATVLQGKISNFDTDLFRPLIAEAAELANVEYGTNHDTDVSLRIIADHTRAATFLISDGVLPSNDGRGYVLRKIMRRAILHGRKLGLQKAFLYKMAGHVSQMMKGPYPELADGELRAAKVVKEEEARFARTLDLGLKELDELIEEALDQSGIDRVASFAASEKFIFSFGPASEVAHLLRPGATPEQNKLAAQRLFPPELAEKFLRRPFEPRPLLDGREAFKLYDTFGLPLDFMLDATRDRGIEFDQYDFDQAMREQRERARASWKGAEKKAAAPAYVEVAKEQKTTFDGYRQVRSEKCQIVALIQKGQIVDEVRPGEEVEIVLEHTPFYAEAGGQVGDVGHFLSPDGAVEVAHIRDTYYPVTGLIAHKAVVRETLRAGDLVTAVVDAERRDAIRRNHTATHLLHSALRHTLGTHVKQAGSLVAPDRLRFDFTHYAALDEQDLLDIEDLVNEHVLANEEVNTNVMDFDAAVNAGAMALFGEKYSDRVRVVLIKDFSKELCGGTHVRRTGDIGLFKVVSEGSVAAGTRRIEALTGTGVLEDLRRASLTLTQLGEVLRAKPDELLEAVEKLTDSQRKLQKQLEAQQAKRAASQAEELVEKAIEVKGVRVISARVEALDRAAMRQMVDSLRAKLQSGVIVLGGVADGKAALIAAVTQDLTSRLDAGKIVKAAAAMVDGTGGGRKDLAEAGGKDPQKLDESLRAVPSLIEKML